MCYNLHFFYVSPKVIFINVCMIQIISLKYADSKVVTALIA